MRYAFLAISAEEEMPLIKELWLYFVDTYVRSATVYPNINVDTDTVDFIKLVILGLCIGISVAGFATVFNKRVLGRVVRRLLKAEAFSADGAKNVDELMLGDDLLTHWALKKSTSVRRVVKCVGEEEYDASLEDRRKAYEDKRKTDRSLPKFKETAYKIDILSDKFYIPEKMRYVADIKFETKGTTWLSAILIPVIMAIVFLVALVALPHLLEFFDGLAA